MITVFVGAVFTEVTDYISILGGLCGVTIAFIVPGMFYVKSNEYKLSHWKNVVTVIIVSLLSCIGFIASGITISAYL